MEQLGHGCCEFDIVVTSDEEMKDVQEKGRDYSYIDPIIKEATDEGSLLKGSKK